MVDPESTGRPEAYDPARCHKWNPAALRWREVDVPESTLLHLRQNSIKHPWCYPPRHPPVRIILPASLVLSSPYAGATILPPLKNRCCLCFQLSHSMSARKFSHGPSSCSEIFRIPATAIPPPRGPAATATRPPGWRSHAAVRTAPRPRRAPGGPRPRSP